MTSDKKVEEMKYKTEFIENEKRAIAVEGIIKRITATVKEEPRHTFLGSTDRKSYTVKVYLQYLAEQSVAMVEVSPWEDNAKESIANVTEKAKFDFATKIYEKLYR